MANISTDLLFGVKGGGSLTGESGRKIEADLKAIIAKIEAKGTTKLKFQADTASLQTVSRQLDAIRQQMVSIGRDTGGLLETNIGRQQTLNRLMAQQLSLQQQAGKAVGTASASAGKSGGGIGSAVTGTMQTVGNATINTIISHYLGNALKSISPVGRLKLTGHMNMPTHARAATRSERAA